MSRTETSRQVRNSICFGTPVGRKARNYVLPYVDFARLSKKVLNHLGERQRDFTLATQLFTLSAVEFTELNAFLILEELGILSCEFDDDERHTLTIIRDVFRRQAIREMKATISFG